LGVPIVSEKVRMPVRMIAASNVVHDHVMTAIDPARQTGHVPQRRMQGRTTVMIFIMDSATARPVGGSQSQPLPGLTNGQIKGWVRG